MPVTLHGIFLPVLFARAMCLVMPLFLATISRAIELEPPRAAAVVLPASVSLVGPASSQKLLLQSQIDSGVIGSAIEQPVKWETSDPSVAAVSQGIVTAVGDGAAVVTARWTTESGAESKVSVDVTVSETQQPREIEFSSHVQAVLARAGCNMGACHGALAGKGGFRLSLRGYDSESDFYTIAREDLGRRVELNSPELSLLLLKPSGKVPHKGGVRLPVDSEGYRVLQDWIKQGAHAPKPSAAKLETLTVYPSGLELKVGDEQAIVVTAKYSDGRTDDVTQWARFSSSDESVANVDEGGIVKVIGNGQTSISVWFASRIENSQILVPFTEDIPPVTFEELKTANAIDAAVKQHLVQLNVAPSGKTTDQEFVRRVYLDTIGKLPTAEEILAFHENSDSNKRSKLIDELLERPEYVDYWAYRWSDLFMLNGAILQVDGVKSYYHWIRNHVEKNTQWDQFASQILTATGEALENGATNFYALNQDPESMTENACQAFLGLSIGCAKCHNHPLEKWTNDQYYAMANMFARVRAKGWAGETRNGDAHRTVVVLDRGDLIQPNKGKPQPPAPLDAPPLDSNSPEDRRVELAQWMTSPSNPYFTRAIVNRVWHAYFGVGIVEPVDDLRASNPESNPLLMQTLTEYLIEHKYDLKSLMRLILNSETYQRSSQTRLNNAADVRFFSHYYPRRLIAEVLHDNIVQVSKIDTEFTQIEFPGNDRRKIDFYPKGTRAIQLYDSAVENSFLRTFGRNQRRIVCECERSNEPSVVQVLHINNGDTINDKLAGPDSIVGDFMKVSGDDSAALVKNAYLRCLSREPNAREQQQMVDLIASADESQKRQAIEDLFWSLMSSREFLFQH